MPEDLAAFEPERRTAGGLSYLDWRPGVAGAGQRTVLLLHGLGDNAWVWGQLGVALAAAGCRVIAPDLPGHGESHKPQAAEPYRFEAIVARLSALLESCGLSSAYILGHSWGGKVVAAWMQTQPQWFRGAILVDPFFNDRLPGWLQLTFPVLYRTLPFLQGMGPFPDEAAARACGRRLRQYRAWTPWQQRAWQAGIEAKADGSWGSKFAAVARNRIFAASLLEAGLESPSSVPTLLVLPERGLNRANWQLQPYKRRLDNLEVARVPGNHWPHLDAPEPFQATIAAFVGVP